MTGRCRGSLLAEALAGLAAAAGCTFPPRPTPGGNPRPRALAVPLAAVGVGLVLPAFVRVDRSSSRFHHEKPVPGTERTR